MKVEFEVSDLIPASKETVYHAWLDSTEHGKMTGGNAQVSDQAGATFEAWDGYIQGKNLELEPSKRILQAWRTSEFDAADEDSILEILFEEKRGETLITIRHSNLPENGMQYQQGWIDSYFNPMKDYFSEINDSQK